MRSSMRDHHSIDGFRRDSLLHLENLAMDEQAQAIAKELGSEVLRARIEGDEIVVVLVDGRKVHRPLQAEEVKTVREKTPARRKDN